MAIVIQMLRSGSSGNAAVVTAGNTRLLIDAGIGPRVLVKELAVLGLNVRELNGVLFTHCHSDHVRGNTLSLLAREGVAIYFNEGTWDTARRREAKAELDCVPGKLLKIFEPGLPFSIAGLAINSCRVSHGYNSPEGNAAGDPVCFALSDGQDKLGYATDIGHLTPEIFDLLRDSGLLVLESNHDEQMEQLSARPYPVKQWIMGDTGHLSNKQAAAGLRTLFEGRERVGVLLAHLSEHCNTVGLARSTAEEALKGRCEVSVAVAHRLRASPPWEVEKGVARPLRETAYDLPRFDFAGWPTF